MAKVNETVFTIDGTSEVRGNCRRIKGEYYRIGDPTVEGSGQCYKVNGKYCRAETGYIIYDAVKGEYVLNNDSYIKGVVGISGGELKLGYFQKPDFLINVHDAENNPHVLLNEDIIKDSREFRYHIERDCYMHISLMPASKFTRLRRLDPGYKNNLPYDSREVMKQYVGAYEKNNLAIDPKVAKLAPSLKGLSFGIEFETVAGQIPDRYTTPLGLIPLRDGSVAGLEYATVPYEGEKGLQAALECCRILDRFTKYDENCSLHLHIGNVPRTEEFFLAIFKTLCLLQDEMYEMFPLYKKYNFGVKRKNFTQPFPAAKLLSRMDGKITKANIKDNFAVLYEFLSAGQRYEDVGSTLDNVENHPSDPNGTRKWNIKSRYFWVNLIPLLFGNKKTVEFRIHTPTTDANKVAYYLMLCTSIVNYVKENTKHILESGDTSFADLGNILMSQMRKAPDGTIDYLLHYINNRKKVTMRNNYDGNIRGNEDAISAINYGFGGVAVKKVPRANPLRGVGGPAFEVPVWR